MCGPIVRPGSVKTAATPTPRSKLARAGARSSDEVINKVEIHTSVHLIVVII